MFFVNGMAVEAFFALGELCLAGSDKCTKKLTVRLKRNNSLQ